MRIEKKKYVEESKWNTATKAGFATLMGLAASATFLACDDSQSASTDENVSQPEEKNIDENRGSSSSLDDNSAISSSEESSSSQAISTSSSQVVVDIPKSSSPISEEVMSSIADVAQSSSSEQDSIPNNPESSSSVKNASSSSSTINDVHVILCPGTGCDNPDEPDTPFVDFNYTDSLIVSMVTTFEIADLNA